MEPTSEDPRVRRLAEALSGLCSLIVEGTVPASADRLVPITPEGLKAVGLEYRPIIRLADEGTLQTRRIGRARFTCHAWLVEMLDRLPRAAVVQARPSPPLPRQVEEDPIAEAIRRSMNRRCGACGGKGHNARNPKCPERGKHE
jgi:hypothetical protein